ncbi:MAG: putative oxidoreductase YdhV [Anaerolineales bacterium]|nr:putative oxidoreductase YdhV [Anaerolineales bacterium]
MLQPILTIDLTSGKIDSFIVPPDWERAYLGGASLAARLLYATLTPDLEPLAAESPLLFLNGPLSGTLGPTVGRYVICGRSPATGIWAEANCGGFWGPELRFAGWDGIWITGRAERPVYLWVNGGQVEVRDAAEAWGQDTYQTQETVKRQVSAPGARVACIGPAGENGVLFSGIFCDHGRAAARTGLGAVMGSKKLKAIAVRGNGKIPLADAAAYNVIRSEANRALKSDNQSRVLNELGTSGVTDYADYLGSMPKMYYALGEISDVDKVSGMTMAETILTGKSACHGCVIACGRVVDIGNGKQKGPEYESIVGLGPNIMIRDLPAIVRLMDLCDRYGMDSISTGNVIGLALHLFDRGLISEKDTDGTILKWGDEATAAKLIHMIAAREGFGDRMAQGSKRFGEHFNAEEEAVQVNGLEVAYHDPRSVTGMALAYATSPRGACHNQSDYFFVDWGQAEEAVGLKFFERQVGAEKSANVAIHQNWRTVFNSIVMCIFANIPPQTQVDLINAANGFDWRVEDMLKCGERGWNLKRAINNRLGLTRANDKLPKGLLEPMPNGGSAGYKIPLDEMLEAYYEARGWDKVTGKPSKEKLLELGMEEVASDLWG